ncbi:MAG TPA: response regulator, partial [Gemmatimonadales bacterium]|nr:response regulator [Gemmatimonadales bacterium]
APARGTLVRMCFPASDAPAMEPRPAPGAAAPKDRRGTILLVEDEDALRRATERLLRRHGYEVVSARDGVDALEICERGEQAIHLILTDVVMPNLGGAALHEELHRRGIRIPMVFTSGYTARDRGGPVDLPDGAPFLPKPWEIRELLLTLEAMMEGPPSEDDAG